MSVEFYIIAADKQGFTVSHEERDKGMRSGQNIGKYYPSHQTATDAIKNRILDQQQTYKTFIVCHYPCDVSLSTLAYRPWEDQDNGEIKWEERLIGVFDDEEQAIDHLFSTKQKIMSVGMEQRLHDKLKDYAKHQQVSVSDLITTLVEKAVGEFPEPRKYLNPETPMLAEFIEGLDPEKVLAIGREINDYIPEKTCTCDGLTLLHYGCRCGMTS